MQKLTVMVKYVFVGFRIFVNPSICMVLIERTEIVFSLRRDLFEKTVGIRSTYQEIPGPVLNSRVLYRVHTSMPLVPVCSHITL